MASALTTQFRTDAMAATCTASSSRYRAYFYGSANAPSASTTAYTSTGQIANSTNYPNTGAAATDGVVLTSTVSTNTMTFTDKVVTSAAGETIGPVYYVLICDTSTSNHTVAFLDYSSTPQTASNGGTMTLDFGAATITLTVA